jgi:predicted secreted hydrolase
MQLSVRPTFPQQEMMTSDTTGISYWEGGIVVEGQSRGVSVLGKGYLELTGYAGRGLGSLLER